MGKDKGGGGGTSAGVISDPRFAKVQTDPRFMRMPKNRTKVAIDKRFAHMFSDKSFADPLGADKRGRAREKKERHVLQRYYKVGEEREEGDDGGGADEEPGMKVKSKGKGKKLEPKEKSKRLARPKFPGPVAPSRLTLEESDDEDESDEEIELEPNLKGKEERKLAAKSAQGKKLGEKVRVKTSKSTLEEIAEEESDEEGASDEEISQRAKVKDKQLPRLKHSAPVVEESDEDDEEIDLNSDESGEESEQDASSDDDEEESSSSSSSSESEPEGELDDPGDEEQVPTATGAETRRFALMNMDWEHIKAVDLLMLMRSFQPKGGYVESVTVYPSEFGIEQMKAEQVHGPNMVFEGESDDDDEDKELNMEKLRAYEKNKLKYYYAVVECDSKETANHLYIQCDGMEFERTSNTLDLRFIPEDMAFVREPRDVAKEVQDGYKAPEFETRALQHSTVKLTWDDDEPTRVKALRRKFNADELNEMDFRAYLASESSEEELGDDEDENPSSPERGDGEGSKSKMDKYRSLLLGDSTEEAELLPGQKKKKGDVDMEVTFHTGLSELSEKLLQKKEAKNRGDETVWEAYLRKKKEKKAAQKKRGKNAKGSDDDYSSEEDVASPREADPSFTHDDTGFDDPFFADAGDFPDESNPATKKSSKEKQSKDSERLKKREEKEQKKKEEEKSKAELELLLMDDEGVQGAARGFNLKSKKDKKKKVKGKKEKGGKDDDDQEEEEEDKLATADLTDSRFAPLFTNHHYAIDPTNPQFRKSAAQLKILAEAQRRRVQRSEDGGNSKAATTVASTDLNSEGSQDRKRKAELSSLVRSLKRKAGKK